MYPELDCILHFNSPLRQEYRNEFSIKSQFEVECGSHECGQNTAQGLTEYTLDNDQKVYAVHLDHHGPNIVFSKETDSSALIRFVEKYFDMSKKTTGLSDEQRGFRRLDPNDSSKGIVLKEGWDNNCYNGLIVNIKYNMLSKDKSGKPSLSLPNVVEFRNDVVVAETYEEIVKGKNKKNV